MGAYTGESAALLTAVFWAFTAIFFTNASRLIGSFSVNMIRIPMAIVAIVTTVWITTGHLVPVQASTSQVLWLVGSGIIGLVLGDTFLFRSLVILGPRLGTLVFACWPILTAVISWIFLGETLGPLAITGILVAFSGIAWVSSEQRSEWKAETVGKDAGSRTLGIVLALAGAIGQAVGLVMAKYAMSDTLAPIEASLVRMIGAFATIWLYGIFSGDYLPALKSLRHRRAILFTLGGAICGPFLGIWMSLVAVKYTSAGVAAAIMASVPVVIIPVSIVVYRQYPSLRAVAGALVTIAGIALLFLR